MKFIINRGDLMSEEILINHCAPTLAGMKTANLFNCKFDDLAQLEADIEKWNKLLNPKGVKMILLQTMKNKALIYVYRPKKLEDDMQCEEVRQILINEGYNFCTVSECIDYLGSRIGNCETFPHEIGLFLGYPVEDVKGFIKYKGQNCKCIGCWKVYCNEDEAQRTFKKFKKCSRVYREKLHQGRPIEKLVVNV